MLLLCKSEFTVDFFKENKGLRIQNVVVGRINEPLGSTGVDDKKKCPSFRFGDKKVEWGPDITNPFITKSPPKFK